MRRLPAHMLGPRADRPPVSTYDQALWWLVQSYGLAADPLARDEPLPDAAVIVADIFWVTQAKVRDDLRKRCSEVGALPAPRRMLRRV